ncbi:hypothetical protein Rhe02_11720 [Rhizocola hellebori]|uniref:Uncharacterized protein n=1 Tax=Rhizocola hellebori TaxID=1392758 RepID=A0A8J3Q3C9_9ACTN|nr:hypothetical protein Rhe02_11720 [Rhizocola hellebori]
MNCSSSSCSASGSEAAYKPRTIPSAISVTPTPKAPSTGAAAAHNRCIRSAGLGGVGQGRLRGDQLSDVQESLIHSRVTPCPGRGKGAHKMPTYLACRAFRGGAVSEQSPAPNTAMRHPGRLINPRRHLRRCHRAG